MNLEPFVAAHLPAAPARVLEIGCGSGALAHAMARLGHDVLAIDPSAPEGDLFRRVTLEELSDPGPYDAVVASRSLHHIHDLPAALDKIAALLAPGGRLLLHEHAWDRMRPTQRWYRQRARRAGTGAPSTPLHGSRGDRTPSSRGASASAHSSGRPTVTARYRTSSPTSSPRSRR